MSSETEYRRGYMNGLQKALKAVASTQIPKNGIGEDRFDTWVIALTCAEEEVERLIAEETK